MNKILNKAITAGMWGLSFVKPEKVNNVIAGEREKTMHYGILFSHSFLKAFFGSKPHERGGFGGETYCNLCKSENAKEGEFCWQTHAVKMVVSENPIAYVEQFL